MKAKVNRIPVTVRTRTVVKIVVVVKLTLVTLKMVDRMVVDLGLPQWLDRKVQDQIAGHNEKCDLDHPGKDAWSEATVNVQEFSITDP